MSNQDTLDKRFHKAFPSGVVITHASSEELEALERRAARRRPPKPVKRAQRDTAMLDSWAEMLSPHFKNGQAVHFTGTYSDQYGSSHGCANPRSVMRDFKRFLDAMGWGDRPYCIGVEAHKTGRAILHLHALIGGSWDAAGRQHLQGAWAMYRGHARATEVVTREQCVRYAAKHCMKTSVEDTFDFSLVARNKSRRERHMAARHE